MSAITVVGGIYHESCIWPEWNQVFGSAGRAAAAISGQVDEIVLRGYVHDDLKSQVTALAQVYGLTLDLVGTEQIISFDYVHSLSVPIIRPLPALIKANPPVNVAADVVLRFGVMEGSALVTADRAVYDPQSAFEPEPFADNGSNAKHLAIVGNRGEIISLGKDADHQRAARNLLNAGAEVVVVKSGALGAFVVDANGVTHIPAYRSSRVWKIGSGDVFAGTFAAQWGVNGRSPVEAAAIASRAVAVYVDTMSLPTPGAANLANVELQEAKTVSGRVYLASPFFTLGQRWVVDEARRCLMDFGLDVFSPVHDVGPGPAHEVAPADLAELDKCDVVFAVLDGSDPGTIFEVGYARAKNKPVYGFAQVVSEEDLKMTVGSGCKVFDDFVSCLHHVSWRS